MNQIRKCSNFIGIVGCVLLLIGSFFTFLTVEIIALGDHQIKSVKLLEENGISMIVITIIAFIFICTKKGKLNYIPAFISIGIVIYDLLQVQEIVNSIRLDNLVRIDIQYESGFFMIILGIIALIVSASLYNNWINILTY